MDCNENRKQKLIEYFASGCKQDKLFGLELEHFVVDVDTGRSISYEDGIEKLLLAVAPLFGEPILSQGRIIGITGKNADITLEPAAQLEVSIDPYDDIAQIKQTYDKFISILTPALNDLNAKFVCLGYHPVSKIDELPLIPKERYNYMYSHFKNTGTCGKYMMKGSAATQVSIDYFSEDDFKKKFRVANILGPLFSFKYDNTPVFEGKPAPHRMIRTHIWNNVDPARSMVVPKSLDGDFGFKEYAEYALSVPTVFETEEWCVEHTLSMLFPDVRLKTNIEIRMVDSIPIEQALEYVTLINNIFYDEVKLNDLYNKTIGVKNADVATAKQELIKNGEDAVVYGRKVKEWLYEEFK